MLDESIYRILSGVLPPRAQARAYPRGDMLTNRRQDEKRERCLVGNRGQIFQKLPCRPSAGINKRCRADLGTWDLRFEI